MKQSRTGVGGEEGVIRDPLLTVGYMGQLRAEEEYDLSDT